MIFASDLDQTIIYSRKSFRTPIEESEIQLVEMLEGKEISFMTIRAISLLKQIHNQVTFIPVTTRTIEQFQRIKIFQNEIIPPYVVTSNGGNILKQGKIDQEWSKIVTKQLSSECAHIEDILHKFQEICHGEWVISQKIADDLFCYSIVDNKKIPNHELNSFLAWLSGQGWNYSLQGRKLYFVPKPVNKRNAVEYIQQKYEDKVLITAGDSLLDQCMLEYANYAFAPLHGELSEYKMFDSLQRTEKKGIYASEEILEHVINLYKRLI